MLLAFAATAVVLASRNNVAPTWSPDSSRLAFVADGPAATPNDHNVWVIGRDGAGARDVTPDDRADTAPSWSPAGTQIAFQSAAFPYTDPTVDVVGADGSGRRTIARGAQPAWSPDGGWIAYVQGRSLRAIRPDGSGDRLVATTNDVPGTPVWSPDGTRLAYTDHYALWVANADGSGARPLVAPEPVGFRIPTRPSWSPDGSLIAFAEVGPATAPQPNDVWLVQPDGTGLRRLASYAYVDGRVTWSHDGVVVTAAHDRDGDVEVYHLALDGTEVDMTRDAAWDEDGVVSPDGRTLAYGVRHGSGYLASDIWTLDLRTRAKRNLTGRDTGVTLPSSRARSALVRSVSARVDLHNLYVTVHVQDALHNDVRGEVVDVTWGRKTNRRATDVHGEATLTFPHTALRKGQRVTLQVGVRHAVKRVVVRV